MMNAPADAQSSADDVRVTLGGGEHSTNVMPGSAPAIINPSHAALNTIP